MKNGRQLNGEAETNNKVSLGEKTTQVHGGEVDAKPKPVVQARKKYEMCKNFKEKRVCKYGDKCLFAHGEHELYNMYAQASVEQPVLKIEETIAVISTPTKATTASIQLKEETEPQITDLLEDLECQEVEEFVVDSPIKRLLAMPN